MTKCCNCEYVGPKGGCTLRKCKIGLFVSAVKDLALFCYKNAIKANITANFNLYCIDVYVIENEKMVFNTHTLFADYNIKEILKIKEKLAAWTKA